MPHKVWNPFQKNLRSSPEKITSEWFLKKLAHNGNLITVQAIALNLCELIGTSWNITFPDTLKFLLFVPFHLHSLCVLLLVTCPFASSVLGPKIYICFWIWAPDLLSASTLSRSLDHELPTTWITPTHKQLTLISNLLKLSSTMKIFSTFTQLYVLMKYWFNWSCTKRYFRAH
jgi:hypothetical protein